MKPLLTTIALAAMLLTSACADQPTTKAHFATVTTIQLTSNTWEEATAAQTAAHATNNNLIMMR